MQTKNTKIEDNFMNWLITNVDDQNTIDSMDFEKTKNYIISYYKTNFSLDKIEEVIVENILEDGISQDVLLYLEMMKEDRTLLDKYRERAKSWGVFFINKDEIEMDRLMHM